MTARRLRGLPPAVRALLLAALLDSIGTGMFLAGGVVFLVRVVGLSGPQLGAGFTAAGVAGLLSAVPLTTMADRVGARRLLVVLQCWRAGCFVLLAFVSGPLTFALAAALQGAGESPVSALTQGVVGSMVGPESRVRTMALMRAVRNVGFSLGSLAAGALVVTDDPWAGRALFLANAASFLVVAWQLGRLRLPPVTVAAQQSLFRAVLGFRDLRYLWLAGLNAVLCLHMTLLSVLLPLWALTGTHAPAGVVPLLLTVNTVLAVLLQVPLAARFDGLTGGRRALVVAGAALVVCCLLAATAGDRAAVPTVVLLAAATVALTLGEILQSTGGWVLSWEYAPPERRSQYLGVFSLGVSLQDVIGPLFLTALLTAAGASGWLVLAVLFAAVALLVSRAAGTVRCEPSRQAAGEPEVQPR